VFVQEKLTCHMPTKQVLLALFACTSFVLAAPQGNIPIVPSFADSINACKGKNLKASCQFSTISGTCQEVKVSAAHAKVAI
jgi:hypothetical protein